MAFDPSVRRDVSGRDPSSLTITSSEVSLTTPRSSDLSQFIDIRVPAGKTYVFPTGFPVTMYLMVHEQFTTDGSAGNDETFSLSNDLVNSPTVQDTDTSQTSGGAEVDSSGHQDLVVYDGGTQKAVVSVDYDANEFTYADAGTASTLDVYYLFGDGGEIQGRAVSENFEAYKQTAGFTPRSIHAANTYNRNQYVTFQEPFQLNPKERLRFLINTSVDLTNWEAISASGPNSTSSYSFFQIPVYKLNA